MLISASFGLFLLENGIHETCPAFFCKEGMLGCGVSKLISAIYVKAG